MTTLETMYLYARLRGIRENLISKTCLSLINMLDLGDHTEKMVQTLRYKHIYDKHIYLFKTYLGTNIIGW